MIYFCASIFPQALSDGNAEYHTAKSNLDFPQHVSTGNWNPDQNV